MERIPRLSVVLLADRAAVYNDDMRYNPYASPYTNGLAVSQPSDDVATTALFLTLIFPLVAVWELAASQRLVPSLPMGNFWFNLVSTSIVFLASVLAIPLAIAGLRTRYRTISAVSFVVGSAEAALIYYVKFHPWILRFF